jgi:hypothetical protein
MRYIFIFIYFISVPAWSIKLGVIGRLPLVDFDSKISMAIKSDWSSCSQCELVNLTSYDDKGAFDLAKQSTKLDAEASNIKIILLTWNERYLESHAAFVASLRKLLTGGALLVMPAGLAEPGSPSVQLSKTIAGQIPGAIIIGELTTNERLLPASYFGPQMLTAIRPPKDQPTESMIAPLLFASRLAKSWNRRGSATEWVEYLNTKRNKSKKIWLALEDFFPR